MAVEHSINCKYDGYIFMWSIPCEGTEFTIYLLALYEEYVVIASEKDDQPCTGKRLVMIMDDEEGICQVATHMLTHLGYQVIVTRDGAEAVEKYRAMYENDRLIDLVIMDLSIPGGMGGKEAVGKIIEINPDAKVLVSSGYCSDPVMEQYNQYGFAGSITKPFTLNELSQSIRSILP